VGILSSKATPMKMFQRRITYLFLLGLLVCSVIGACGRSVNHPVKNSEQATPECRVVAHVMGKTCIPHNPKRVVTISHFALANALALGIKPIGSTSASSYSQDNFPPYLRREIGDIPVLGSQGMPNLEKISLLKPDLIISWDLAVRSIYPLLSQISPTIMLRFGETPDWKDFFNLMAEALGKQDVAQQEWDRYYQRIEKLKLALKNRYVDKTISVITLAEDSTVQVWGRNSFAGSILKDIGLKRPKSQDIDVPNGLVYYPLSEEKLGEMDADILFIQAREDVAAEASKKWQQDPLWRSLKAVQQRQVYVVDVYAWIGSNLIAADAVIDDLFKYLVDEQ
jgi:iron complex transport system substrate-binding protein